MDMTEPPAYRRGPRWLPRRALRQSAVPGGLREWLFDRSSLTRRVQEACGPHFRVELLEQGWRRPYAEEARRLGLRAGARALVRHVYLSCGTRPWVFARTIIPHHTLSGTGRHLARLGTRPLGAVLFADPGACRQAMEFTAVGGLGAMYPAAAAASSDRLWGRRSLFCLHAKPLLVSEFFLPALVERTSAQNDPRGRDIHNAG